MLQCNLVPFGRPVLYGTFNTFCSRPCVVRFDYQAVALNGADRYVDFMPLRQLIVHFAYRSV